MKNITDIAMQVAAANRALEEAMRAFEEAKQEAYNDFNAAHAAVEEYREQHGLCYCEYDESDEEDAILLKNDRAAIRLEELEQAIEDFKTARAMLEQVEEDANYYTVGKVVMTY